MLLLCSACAAPAPRAREALGAFYAAVQREDVDALFCMMAGVADAEELGTTLAERRTNFESWVLSRLEAYERDRDEGRVDLDEQGLTLVKLFALGRGTYVSYGMTHSPDPDARVLESEVRFGYAHIDLSRFSPGTTFYVCGSPVGTVEAVQVPAEPREISVELLERVRVDWTLLRSPETESCPERWTVASAEVVEGTETLTTVTWMF